MCPRERFTSYKSLFKLVLCYKKDWATLLHFIYFCYLLLVTIILSQNYLLPIISVLAENTLLKTTYHFLLLLVGFDTLTYRKDTIDPLYLWVIKTLFLRRCWGVKRLWYAEFGHENFI